MIIRGAVKEDLLQIFDIEREAISPPWSHDALVDELSREDSFFVVAIGDDGSIAGFAIMRKVGDDGELLQIAVNASMRGCGIGDLLMTAVIEYAKERSFLSVFLEVRISNIAATRLYEKYGFEAARVRKDYYDSPFEDALVMVKVIN